MTVPLTIPCTRAIVELQTTPWAAEQSSSGWGAELGETEGEGKFDTLTVGVTEAVLPRERVIEADGLRVGVTEAELLTVGVTDAVLPSERVVEPDGLVVGVTLGVLDIFTQ